MTDSVTGESVQAAFQSSFGKTGRVFRAPARINIIGEHCDYNDGFVMPTNTALYTWLAIAPREDNIVHLLASDLGQATRIRLDHLYADPEGGWQEYLKGVLKVLRDEGFELGGADILISGEIPHGGGLSSSASLETVLAYAMLSCSGYDIDRRRLALMCKTAENQFVGVACGVMDQYVISLCSKDAAMLLDCRSLKYKPVPLPRDASLLVINSGVVHSLRAGSLNKRRQECERAVDLLKDEGTQIAALRDLDMAGLDASRNRVGDILYRRCRHVITETQRVHDAFHAMLLNDPVMLGQLMNQSHQSLKTDFEVSCSELDFLVDVAQNCKGVYGSRMVGAGFGGCTVSLVKSDKVKEATERICAQYRPLLGHEPWHHVVEPSEPVQEVQFQ